MKSFAVVSEMRGVVGCVSSAIFKHEFIAEVAGKIPEDKQVDWPCVFADSRKRIIHCC